MRRGIRVVAAAILLSVAVWVSGAESADELVISDFERIGAWPLPQPPVARGKGL